MNNECVVCHRESNGFLVGKRVGDQYPFCDACADKGWYNSSIFEYRKNTGKEPEQISREE